MRANFGEHFKLTIFGESHGPAIGVVVDGLPAGARLDEADRRNLYRQTDGAARAGRRPDRDGAKRGGRGAHPLRRDERAGDGRAALRGDRKHEHALRRLCKHGGAHAPRPRGLRGLRQIPRHERPARRRAFFRQADGAALHRRLLLREKGIEIGAHIAAIAGERDARFDPVGVDVRTLCGLAQSRFPLLNPEKEVPMRRAVAEARAAQDSAGGVIECAAVGVRAGIGSPFFGSVESVVSQLAFSVPAVKAIEFGDGMALAEMRGGEANDAMRMDGDDVTCESNHNGGVTGGVTNGMPVIFRAAIKPTPSIARAQRTVDVAKCENAVLEIAGRHDPCIVPRAVVVMESILAIALCELEMDDAAQRALTEGVCT